jgi:hypothetical protein
MTIEIVDLPIENGGSFHSFLYVYQRVQIEIHVLCSRHPRNWDKSSWWPHVPLWLCVPPQPLHWFVLIRHVHKTTIKMASWDLLGTVDQALDTSDCVVLFNLDIPMIPPWILNEAWTKTRAAIGSLSATAMETWRDPGICNTKPKLGWLFHSRVQQFPKVSEPYTGKLT